MIRLRRMYWGCLLFYNPPLISSGDFYTLDDSLGDTLGVT
jgi:hypothetical protein